VPAPVSATRPATPVTPTGARAPAKAFGVHVSSFRRRTTAEADARRLGSRLSLPARVVEVDLGAKGVWYRVIVGEAGTAAEASALRERLKQKGFADGVVQGF
jgi:cell division protein FtsN